MNNTSELKVKAGKTPDMQTPTSTARFFKETPLENTYMGSLDRFKNACSPKNVKHTQENTKENNNDYEQYVDISQQQEQDDSSNENDINQDECLDTECMFDLDL